MCIRDRIHVDENHPTLIEGLKKLGYKNDKYYKLHFIDFYNNLGEKGYPKFEIQEL